MSVQQACTGPEMVPGALRGYRTWHFVNHFEVTATVLTDGTLRAIEESRAVLGLRGSYGQFWESSRLAASCRLADHSAPNIDCKCGIYAYYRPSAIAIGGPQAIVGVVEATGRVLMGERGFRAEHARILAIAPTTELSEWTWTTASMELIAAKYPDVAVLPSLTALVAEFPPDDVTELVGEVPDGPPPAAAVGMFVMGVMASAQAFNDAMRKAAETLAQASMAMADAAEGLRQVGIAFDTPPPLPTDPKQRALEVRRRRNTGPQTRYRLDGSRTPA